MKNALKRTGSCLLLFLLLFSTIPLCAGVVADESRMVRVGWYNSDHFQEGGGAEQKSGYSYEYV